MTLRLAWASDIHLDCCDNATAREFAEECADRSDALVITGDITNGRETTLFTTFAARYGKPVYFVLGNHDYWHSSFSAVRALWMSVSLVSHNARFLDSSAPIDLVPGVQLCGVSGWYDARLGNQNSGLALQDWWAIEELNRLRSPGNPLRMHHTASEPLRKEFRKLASASAKEAKNKLTATTAKHVFFATHVPPFAEAAWHLGRRSDDDALPYYTNRTLGLALNRWAAASSDRNLTTLCGHSHSRGDYQALPNHIVRTAAADYGRPSIEHVFELGDT